MGDKSKIEWTDTTWNPVTGCTKVSAGCKHCYAERGWPRLSANPRSRYHGRAFTDVQCHQEKLDEPLHWRKPRRVFVNSMSDLFHEAIPFEFIDQVFAIMACAVQHKFQVLTKRPQRMREYLTSHAAGGRHIWEAGRNVAMPRGQHKPETGWPFFNIWLGVSVEDQATADERIRLLLQTPAAVRLVSYEPALEPVDFGAFAPFSWKPIQPKARSHLRDVYPHGLPANSLNAVLSAMRLDWIIAGGESGPNARPSHPDWFRSVRDQCQAAGVAFFFKQWGEWIPRSHNHDAIARDGKWGTIISDGEFFKTATPFNGHDDDGSGEAVMLNVGKKAAGRELDGRTWDEYPCS